MLPNPGMSFTPFDPLTAAELNDIVENVEALADFSAYDDGSLPINLIDNLGDVLFDHVVSGCVITGTGYGSTLAWSMTAGVVYIGGRRYTVAAATGTVTASRDTYFDVLKPVSGSVASLVNTSGNIVTNNAASPALAANSIRIGIVVSGASSIASVASINQGQETKVLPIVSSVPYTVTDSLGNLICPRDPNRRVLGFRRITSDFSTASATDVQVTGLSAPVIIPTDRKVRITCFGTGTANSSAGAYAISGLYRGAVGGTRIAASFNLNGAATREINWSMAALDSSSSGLVTYNVGLSNGSVGTASLRASSNAPAFVMVELV